MAYRPYLLALVLFKIKDLAYFIGEGDTIAGNGAVAQASYDDAGRVTATTAYATELTGAQLASLGSTPTAAQVAALITPNANDRHTYTAYDNAGRVVDSVNALGAVTQYSYDPDGRRRLHLRRQWQRTHANRLRRHAELKHQPIAQRPAHHGERNQRGCID